MSQWPKQLTQTSAKSKGGEAYHIQCEVKEYNMTKLGSIGAERHTPLIQVEGESDYFWTINVYLYSKSSLNINRFYNFKQNNV